MTLAVLEPATEAVLAEIPRAGVEETDAAVARAKAAYPAWRAVAPADRAKLLHGLADALAAEQEELAVLEARNAGKPIGDARGEMGMVVDTFRFYAGAVERTLGDTIPVAGGVAMTFREPLGVVALITPWNFPLTIASWKLAPCLAAGNTVVLKPAELTPLTALEFERIALAAGIPEGVVNVVAGPGSTCGARLVEHPDVAKVAFTGSTEVGRRIAAGAAQTIKRVTLELGGKSPNLVFADADLQAAAEAAPWAVFGNAGQDCCARSRILVQDSVMDEFLAVLSGVVEGIRVGDPLDEATQMGPLISAQQRETVGSYVPEGAPVAARGSAPAGPGFWFPPTVLAPVDPGRPRRARRDLRPGRMRDPVPRRGRGGRAGQRHDLRPLRLDLDARRSPRAARRARGRGRRAVDQLEHLGAREHAVRRLQAVRRRPRAGPARARPLHRGQVRLLRNGGLAVARLEGKVCVVTGAASGIGAETAQLFVDEGATVVGADLRDDGVGTLALAVDVSDEQQVSDLYARARSEYGRIDVLFNNAGISPTDDASVLDTSLVAWQRVQDVNLKSVFLCCKHGIPHLIEGGGGSVINTASFVATMGSATSQISYTASKGGVLALSRELGVEFARHGVRVNALCPGPVNTPLLQELFAKDPVAAARRLVHVPAGRFAEVREIANAVLFLASDESTYVNATTFMVDGGISQAYTTPE